MDEQLKNLKFSTKSIMITDKQKETISYLLDQLSDLDCDDFDDIQYWKLNKQDASKLISEMIDRINELNEYFRDWYEDITYNYYD